MRHSKMIILIAPKGNGEMNNSKSRWIHIEKINENRTKNCYNNKILRLPITKLACIFTESIFDKQLCLTLDVTSIGISMPSFRRSVAIFLCRSFSKFCRCVTYSLCKWPKLDVPIQNEMNSIRRIYMNVLLTTTRNLWKYVLASCVCRTPAG